MTSPCVKWHQDWDPWKHLGFRSLRHRALEPSGSGVPPGYRHVPIETTHDTGLEKISSTINILEITLKKWTDKQSATKSSLCHEIILGFWLANLQMPNQLSVSVPYRWLLLFPQLHHVQSFDLSTCFLFFCFKDWKCMDSTLAKQDRLHRPDSWTWPRGWKVVLCQCFWSILTRFYWWNKVLWRGLGRCLGFLGFNHQRYGQVAQCEGIPGFGLAWCCWLFLVIRANNKNQSFWTNLWSFTVFMHCTWSLDPGLFWRPWLSFAIPPFGPLQSHRCGRCKRDWIDASAMFSF